MPKPLTPEKKQEWKDKIHEQEKSGLSIEGWCRENQIPSYVFHYWKKRLFPKTNLTPASFTELVNPKGCTIDIECQDVRIHLESSTLKQCLKILKELKC